MWLYIRSDWVKPPFFPSFLSKSQLLRSTLVSWQLDNVPIECAVRVLSPARILKDQLAIGRVENRVRFIIVCCEHGSDREAIFRFELKAVIEILLFSCHLYIHLLLTVEDIEA